MVDSLQKVTNANNIINQPVKQNRISNEAKNISGDLGGGAVDDIQPFDDLSLLTEEELLEVLERVRVKLESVNIAAEYSVHERTNTIMVKLINVETNEIIKEIPPEKLLDMVGKLWDLAGLLVDEKI